MQCFRSPITLLLLLLLLHHPTHAQDDPIPAAGQTRLQAVIELLEDMAAKGRQAKLEEAKTWGEYESRFCKVTVRKTEQDIDEATEKITMLEAEIERWATELNKLGGGIKKAQEEVMAWKNDTVALDAAHAKSSAENNAVIQDHKESVYALEGAIQTLPGHDDTVAQAPTLIEGAIAAHGESRNTDLPAEVRELAINAAREAGVSDQDALTIIGQKAADLVLGGPPIGPGELRIAAATAAREMAEYVAEGNAATTETASGVFANAFDAVAGAVLTVRDRAIAAAWAAPDANYESPDAAAAAMGWEPAFEAAAAAAARNEDPASEEAAAEAAAAATAAEAALARGESSDHAVAAGKAAAAAIAAGLDADAAAAAGADAAADVAADLAAEEYQNPEVHAYDYQSGGILGTLEGLLVKFKDELAAAEQKKADDESRYTTERQQLQDNIKMTEESIQRKGTEMARVKARKDKDEESLADTQSKLKVDVEYLDNLRTTCSSKASAFESRQALRAEELDTLLQVIKVLQSDTVSSRDLVQAEGGAALAAIRGAVAGDGNQKQRVLGFLMRRASALKSHALEEFASLISQGGPFTNVKKMIQDLIERLEKEARDDADHDYMCQRELKMNEESRTSKETKAKRLEADIAELKVQIQVLTTEIDDLTTQVADLNADLKNATAVRESESAENLATIKDAGETQKALAGAITFLTDFYNKAGAATAFVQDNPEVPAIFDSPYKGMQAEGSNVDAFLKVLLSDFAKLEHETEVQERTAAAEHQKYEQETQLAITSFTKDIEYKTKESTAAKKALSTAEAELEANAKALSLANEEYEALKPQCVYVEYGDRHEDRVAQRQLEVQSLQEALEILQDVGSLDEATTQPQEGSGEPSAGGDPDSR